MNSGKIERKRGGRQEKNIKEKGHMWLREKRSLSLPSAADLQDTVKSAQVSHAGNTFFCGLSAI